MCFSVTKYECDFIFIFLTNCVNQCNLVEVYRIQSLPLYWASFDLKGLSITYLRLRSFCKCQSVRTLLVGFFFFFKEVAVVKGVEQVILNHKVPEFAPKCECYVKSAHT